MARRVFEVIVVAKPRILRRRMLLGGAISAFSLAATRCAWAIADAPALDTPAIPVKDPAGVLLVAITLSPANRLVAVGEHGVIIYSDDNGVTWTQASVPVNVTLTCVAFATPKIGWAAGHSGVILGSRDGGDTWQMQLTGSQANQLAMTAATDPSIAENLSPGAPIAVRRAQHYLDVGPGNPYLTILVLSPQKLIVFGAYRMAVLSNDGGKTWVDWDLHIYDKFSHNIYDAAMIGGSCYLVSEEGLIFGSTDGANIFRPMTPPGGVTLLAVLGAPDGSVIVCGVAGFAARSTDQGKSWTTLSIATQEDLTSGRPLADGGIVLVDESGLLFESRDNGATFARIQGIQPVPFFDVQQARNGNLIAVGATGVTQIAKSLLAS